VKLICFPFAGGSSALFKRWARALPLDCEIIPFELAGRGRRLREPPMTSVEAVVADAFQTLRDELREPFGFFGHSFGGMIAFELAHRCRRELGREPEFLIASGVAPPRRSSDPPRDAPTELTDDSALVARLEAIGGTPPEVLENGALLQMLMPALKADFRAVDGYQSKETSGLSCPVAAFAGASDLICSPEDAWGWSAETSGIFRRYVFKGGHFFISDQEPLVLTVLGSLLEEVLAARPEDSSHGALRGTVLGSIQQTA
jgi:medium-chain acyl-[acyl-carrier-protein] hydrolase